MSIKKLSKDVLILIILKMEEEKIKWYREELKKRDLKVCSNPNCMEFFHPLNEKDFCSACDYFICAKCRSEGKYKACGPWCIHGGFCEDCMDPEYYFIKSGYVCCRDCSKWNDDYQIPDIT